MREGWARDRIPGYNLNPGRETPWAIVTFDVEMDAPPYMSGWRGVDEGLPAILEVLDEKGVKATFFTLGLLAVRKPRAIKAILDPGHEIGSHGFDHKRLDRLPLREAIHNIGLSLKLLRDYYDVVSFRAPNLKLPPSLIPALRLQGVKVDSSISWYKPPFKIAPLIEYGILRVPASYPSSVLRLPWRVLKTLFKPGLDYVILLHPWEVVDLKCGSRPDLTVGVGGRVLGNLSALIDHLRSHGYMFKTMRELLASS
jgi:peptidoglycan/xylan/chitin deacetylase (PgdA/CDA1 family)